MSDRQPSRGSSAWASDNIEDFLALKPADFAPTLGALAMRPPECRWHPNGFATIVLGQHGPFTSRLHLWPDHVEGPRQPGFEIHDHHWKIRSLVIVGELLETRWTVVPSPSGELAMYEVVYDAEQSALAEVQDRIAVVPEAHIRRPAGSHYTIPASEFHTAINAGSRVAVSAVAAGPRLGRRPRVVGARAASTAQLVTRREVVSPTLVAGWAREALAQI